MGVRAVILVPRREGFAQRDATWSWVKRWWQEHLSEYPIFEGHHDLGLFNRSAALNTASRLAGDWDVAIVIDADVICDPKHVRDAVQIAIEHGRMVVPFTVRHNLNEPGSRKIMDGEQGPWEGYIARNYYDQHSSVVVIPRNIWDTVGGFDETFAGWGMEDTAFACAVTVLVAPLHHMEGEVWHFWHETAPEGHVRTPSANANRARGAKYQAAMAANDADAIRKLIGGKHEPFSERTIPRIFHRVVPEQTTDEVEAWWTELQRLHPGWRFMTHRDPLMPTEWPETSGSWRLCKSGAQLAGLVRLEALHRYGGIYLDSDVEPYRNFEALLPLEAFAAWEDDKVVPDAVLGARRGHPAIQACIRMAIKEVRHGAWRSGPGVTTKVLPNRPDVLLLPPGSFYPYHYKEKERRSEDHRRAQPWAFAAHHWYGSWLKEKA